ncbi:hypothetical protein [Mycolicibacterium sp.]|uniref:hypothetical protein n=1 Tax=Mycolicibacterium sp. TaxID=2320850 RepID=UPI003D140DFC
MTGSDDHSATRPISVAELLAKNGTIGAPPVGGRRRRRRGNADAVTVAELTGEIPIIRPDQPPVADEPAKTEPAGPEAPEPAEAVAEPDEVTDSETQTDVETEPEAEVDEAEVDEAEVDEAEVDEVVEAGEQAAAEAPDETQEETSEEPADVGEEPAEDVGEEPAEDVAEEPGETASDEDEVDDDYAEAVAEYTAHLEQRTAEPEPVEFQPPARRFGFGRKFRKAAKDDTADTTDTAVTGVTGSTEATAQDAVDAELMSPDPVDVEADADSDLDETPDKAVGEVSDDVLADAPEVEDLDTEDALSGDDDDDVDDDGEDDRDELPSYLRSTQEPLFGGQTIADDLARRGARSSPEDIDLGDEEDDEFDDDAVELEPRRMSPFVHGVWIVVQSVIAVALGAGLFVAFDQLWKWNNIVALVLSVLVILGLVVAVRVVRKTEDIGSTLIAVAVGALVTLGPLALLQSG